jgi:protein SCO1/2
MAEFVGAFDPRITGLTGTLDQIKASTKSFKVYYAKAVQKEAPDGYTMEHTTSLYLIDPKGRFVRPYSYNATVNENADDLQARL